MTTRAPMSTRVPRTPARSSDRQQQVDARFDALQELLRDLSGIREKPLWGGLVYRYGERVFFTLTRRPQTVLLEMKLTDEAADLALRLPYVHPHSFTRLARTGWVAISVRPETPLTRIQELVEQSYEHRRDEPTRRPRRR